MSAPLEEQLRAQLTSAIKAKDLKTANLVRMINTKIMERRTAKGFTGVVDDAMILDVISAYKKQMEKARTEYAALGDRGSGQVEELDFELRWCAGFLPAQLSEVELRAAVTEAVAALPSRDPKMAGKIIGVIKKQFGDRADPAATKRIADELLSAPA